MDYHLLVLLLALPADRLIGDPDWLWRRLPHPVVLFGAAISVLDRRLNRDGDVAENQRLRGAASLAGLLVLSVLVGALLSSIFDILPLVGFVLEVAVVTILIAQRSLADHVGAVAAALRRDGLAGGRQAVAKIVGRDPQSLDRAGVSRAAIESLTENFSDGVVAPVFWYALFGLPGLLAYKMLNTADSMIGHKSDRYRHFGWASARLDDAANWPAARLSALLIAAAALCASGYRAAARALSCALRDAGLHRSPNAGWPECAMAGALGVSLAGERRYGGVLVREPRLNAAGRHRLDAGDIEAAIRLFQAACSALLVTVLVLLIGVA